MKGILTTIDYPGKLAILIPLYGCKEPYCEECLNPEMLVNNANSVVELTNEINEAIDILDIDAVVLGGGDPMANLTLSLCLAQHAHNRGLLAGLQTSWLDPYNSQLLAKTGLFDYILYTTQKIHSDEEYEANCGAFRKTAIQLVTKVLDDDFKPANPVGEMVKGTRR